MDAFRDEQAARSRCVVASSRLIVVASIERVVVWAWAAVDSGTTRPLRVVRLQGLSVNPRDDYSHLGEDGLLLLGSNNSFAVFDLCVGACIYKAHKRSSKVLKAPSRSSQVSQSA